MSTRMTQARLVQWAHFQAAGPRDSAPVAIVLGLAAGLALVGAVLVVTVGALL